GGCRLMHLSNDAYKHFKRQLLTNALRQAGFADMQADIAFFDAATRRRVELKWDGAHLSYYRLRSRDLVPVESCLILEPALQALLAPLTAALAALPFTTTI